MKNTISNNIKLLRKQHNFSKTDIATYLNVDADFISKIETNQQHITTDILDKLAILFGITPQDFNKNLSEVKQLSISPNKNITSQDLTTIGAINNIALNINFMKRLLNA